MYWQIRLQCYITKCMVNKALYSMYKKTCTSKHVQAKLISQNKPLHVATESLADCHKKTPDLVKHNPKTFAYQTNVVTTLVWLNYKRAEVWYSSDRICINKTIKWPLALLSLVNIKLHLYLGIYNTLHMSTYISNTFGHKPLSSITNTTFPLNTFKVLRLQRV